MKANFEVIAWKNGVRTVRTWTLTVYEGVTADLHDRYEAAGYTDISVRMI